MTARGTDRLKPSAYPLLVAVVAAFSALTPAPASAISWSGPQLIDHQAPFDIQQEINRVSCPSTSLCVAGDGTAHVLASTNPTGGAGAWSVAHLPGVQSIWGLSCPSTSLCVG